MVKLTKRAVDTAYPRAERYYVWDSELKGFAVRVAPSGTKTYIVRYRPKNMVGVAPKRFVVLGRHGPLTPDAARSQARALLGEVAMGKDPAAWVGQRNKNETVAAIIDIFLNQHIEAKRKSGTLAGYRLSLTKYVLPVLGPRVAEGVTTGDIAKIHHALRGRPYQANRVLAILASMYGFACKQGILPSGTNPCAGVERYRESSRDRYLTTDELRRLGDTLRLAETTGIPWKSDPDQLASKHLPAVEARRTLLPPEVVLALRLLLFTGARLREILHLKWRHVDVERGLLLLPDSKTGRKTIVLSALAVALLREATRSDPYVIPGALPNQPRADLKKPWAAIQRHAGLEGVRLHDLRHTFASIGAGASLGLPVVGKLLGHTQPATTARYAHLDADPLRRATDLIGTQLAAALAPIVEDKRDK